MIVIAVAARIMVPVIVVMPSVVAAVPPLMVLIPAALSFGAKLVPSSICLGTVLSMALNCAIELGPRVFDAALTLGTVVGMSELWSGEAHEQHEHSQKRGCQCGLRQSGIRAELACIHSDSPVSPRGW